MRNAAQRAIESVREFGAQVGTGAQALRAALPTVRLSAGDRTRALELCDHLSAVAAEVTAGAAGLDAVNARSDDEIREVLRTLTMLEAQGMQVLSALTFLAEALEQAAERDESNEPAYVLVIESAGGLMQSFEKAKTATESLRAMLDGRG